MGDTPDGGLIRLVEFRIANFFVTRKGDRGRWVAVRGDRFG
jgi:hypothetical protein